MADNEKPFIRVKDTRTGHQYDIHRSRFDDAKHEKVDRVPDAWKPRPAKTSVTSSKARTAATTPAARKPKTSTEKVVEGVSPTTVSAS